MKTAVRSKFAFTKECWREFRTLALRDDVVCDQHLYTVDPKLTSKIYVAAFGAMLNSSWVWLMREVHGREASGQAMSRSEITVGELKKLPVPDLRNASKKQLQDLSDSFSDLLNAENQRDKKGLASSRRKIDSICLNLCGDPCTVKELQQAVVECVRRRVLACHQYRVDSVAV